MADFINFEADIEDIGENEGDEVSDISDVESGNSFIDNQDVNTDANFYRHFENVENDIEQVLKDTYMKHLRILKYLMKYQIYAKALKKNLKLIILTILK